MISAQTKRRFAALYLALLAGLAIGAAGIGLLHARQDAPAPGDTAPPKVAAEHLLTKPLVGEPGKEVDIQVYTFPPQSAVPWHIHAGAHEFEYGLEGTLMIEEKGKPPHALKAGETYYLAPDVVHRGWNPSKTEPAKIYVVRVKPKGAPLASIVDGAKSSADTPSAGDYPEDTQ